MVCTIRRATGDTEPPTTRRTQQWVRYEEGHIALIFPFLIVDNMGTASYGRRQS